MRASALIMVVLLAAWPACAHESKGPHGGRLTDLGPVHGELVAKDNVVELYLTDSADKPVSASGYKGLAILTVLGKSERVILDSAEGNRLSGKASAPLSNPKGVVRLTGPDGETHQAKF